MTECERNNGYGKSVVHTVKRCKTNPIHRHRAFFDDIGNVVGRMLKPKKDLSTLVINRGSFSNTVHMTADKMAADFIGRRERSLKVHPGLLFNILKTGSFQRFGA